MRKSTFLHAATIPRRSMAPPCRHLELQAFSSSVASPPATNGSAAPSHQNRNNKRWKKSGTSPFSKDGSNEKGITIKEMYRDTLGLVNKATQRTPERHGWHHTKRLRGEEKRLRSAPKSGQALEIERERDREVFGKKGRNYEQDLLSTPKSLQQTYAPSATKQTFCAKDESQEFEEVYVLGYPMGAFVETRRNNIAAHGIVVGEEYQRGRVFCTCLMSSGEIWAPNAQDVFFVIPSIVPTDLATRCGSEEITDRKSSLHARVETLRRMRLVERALEDTYNVVCSRAHGLYDQIRDRDPDMWGTTTVDEVARVIDKNPSLIMTFAVHKFLMNHPAWFIADQDYRRSQSFRVVPLSHVKDLETMEGWMRNKQKGPLINFSEKARNIMIANAKRLEDTFTDSPSGVSAQVGWDENDQVILRFMIRALRPTRSNQEDPYAVAQSTILKLLDSESLSVGDTEMQRALIRLGVLAPWQDLVMIQPQLGLDLEPEHTSQRIKNQNEMVQRGFEKVLGSVLSSRVPGPLGPEDFYPADPLESVRHDFGDMKAYVVDEPNAHELDDGVSIERLPSEPGCFWVHIHIADPGSVIPPSHVFATEARKQQETAYFYPKTWPLFPRSLMHSPTHGLSLGSKRDKGLPDRVLTFSAKVDEHANILDYKVRAGLIRNVRVVDYDTVDRALGVSFERCYPFGRVPSLGVELDQPPLTEEEIQDFRDLLVFAKAFIRERGQSDSYQIFEERFSLNGLSSSVPKDLPMDPSLGSLEFSGFPLMEYEVHRGDGSEVGARSIIAEAAKMTCRIASRFALDNGNIPLLRRHVPKFVANSPEDLKTLLDARTPEGYVSNWQAAKYVSLNPSSVYTLQPKGHFVLGVPDGEGYARATSPLRRYSDLMAHWQLHHALLGNRAISRKPPFSEKDMEEYKTALTRFEHIKKSTQAQHVKYWQALFIHRWLEGVRLGKIDPGRLEGGNPIDRLSGRTLMSPALDMQTRRYQADVHIPLLGLRGMVGLPDSAKAVEIGTLVDVRIKGLKLGVRPQIALELKG